MTLTLDEDLQSRVAATREWGREKMRPAGAEADRLGAPLPVDHPYFQAFIAKGGGRTAWGGVAGPRRVVESAIIAEESAYWDRGVSIANPGPGLPEGLVLSAGTEEQKERFLGPFVEPDQPRWASLAMTEPGGGSDTAAFKTRAVPDGDGWVLTGAKCFIGNASRADWVLVQATVEPEKPRGQQRTFFVEKGTPGLGGFRIEKKMGLKAYESTTFMLDECHVPGANLLGGPERDASGGHGSAMRALNATRPIVAANAIGMARAAYDEAMAFAKDHALRENVRVRDRLERAARKIRGAWLLTLKAAWLADAKQANLVEASMAKACAADVLEAITQDAMELIGLVGARGDHLIEKLFRDAKAMNIVEGTGQIQRVIIARNLLGLAR
jgi:acyl-CoA dehydrogenase